MSNRINATIGQFVQQDAIYQINPLTVRSSFKQYINIQFSLHRKTMHLYYKNLSFKVAYAPKKNCCLFTESYEKYTLKKESRVS